jgi:hypothetical protein
VILEYRETDPVECRFGSRELLKNVHAEARLLHHAPNAANLSLDPVQPRDEALLLCLIQHEVPRNAPRMRRSCELRRRAGSVSGPLKKASRRSDSATLCKRHASAGNFAQPRGREKRAVFRTHHRVP